MEQSEALADVIRAIDEGQIPLRDLAGLDPADMQALAYLGRMAFEACHFDKAVKVFAGLEILEPDRPEHLLRRAHAEAKAGRTGAAVTSVTRYLDADVSRPADEMVRALVFRAGLILDDDRAQAELDLQVARMLGERSPAAKAVVEGLLP